MVNKKVFLIGGGTGGHVIPVYRLYARLVGGKGIETHIIGSGSPIEQKFFAGLPGYLSITAGKLHRSLTLRNLKEFLYFLLSIFSSLFLLLKYRPDLIFSKGGYVALPFMIWARILKIPYFIHESDIEMGAANRLSSAGAKTIFTGFPVKYYPEAMRKRAVFSGQLIDASQSAGKGQIFDFGFDAKPVIFFAGGSQGSLTLNKCLYRSLPELLLKYNIIHQTGFAGYEEALKQRAKLTDDHKKSYFIKDFLSPVGKIDLMEGAIHSSDLIVSRAGATSIAEIAQHERPMLLIPYQYASGNHQQKNAEALKKAGAAEIITEKELIPESLIKTINKLFSDFKKRKEMAKNAASFFPANGLELVYKEIIDFLKG